MQYRADLDGLRALSVLGVVAYHYFPAYVPNGMMGVDIFFVISGFLITRILLDDDDGGWRAVRAFYVRRIRRIFPALLITMLGCAIAGWLIATPSEHRLLGVHLAAASIFSSNLLLLAQQDYFAPDAIDLPLLHLWSLAIEEQFYLIFPLLVLFLPVRRDVLNRVVLALMLLSLGAYLWAQSVQPQTAFYSPATRAWQILAGSVGAFAVKAFPRDAPVHTRPLSAWISAAPLILLLGLFLLQSSSSSQRAFSAIAATALAVTLIARPGTGPTRWVLSARPLVAIGLISYPLYLFHWPAIVYLRHALVREPTAGEKLLAAGLCFVAAWLVYKWIEIPARRSTAPALTKALVAALLLLGGWGGVVAWQAGFPGRDDRVASIKSFEQLRLVAQQLRISDEYVESLKEKRRIRVRAPQCHINNDPAVFAAYRAAESPCLRVSDDLPNVLVIGDSHAADVYGGLSKTLQMQANILQATSGACAPDGRSTEKSRFCSDLISIAMNLMESGRIESLIVAAKWSPLDIVELRAFLIRAKAHVKTVILVSPPVSFNQQIAKLVQRFEHRLNPQSVGDEYFDNSAMERRLLLSQLAKEVGVEYLDLWEALCPMRKSCPILTPSGELITWDYGHLTVAGMDMLGERISPSQIIKTKP